MKIEDTKHLSNLLSLTIITFPFHPCDQPLIEEREVRNDQVLGTERELMDGVLERAKDTRLKEKWCNVKEKMKQTLGSLDHRRNAFINITNLIRSSSNGLG